MNGKDVARQGTDEKLEVERDDEVISRRQKTSDRGETDEALKDERWVTDEHDRESMDESDAALDRWRGEHAADGPSALGGATHGRLVVPSWLNFAMILLVLAWMAIITSQVIVSTARIAEINARQIITVQQQNDQQLCVQHDIVSAIKKIGLKLGLPVVDIVPPDITGLECDAK